MDCRVDQGTEHLLRRAIPVSGGPLRGNPSKEIPGFFFAEKGEQADGLLLYLWHGLDEPDAGIEEELQCHREQLQGVGHGPDRTGEVEGVKEVEGGNMGVEGAAAGVAGGGDLEGKLLDPVTGEARGLLSVGGGGRQSSRSRGGRRSGSGGRRSGRSRGRPAGGRRGCRQRRGR